MGFSVHLNVQLKFYNLPDRKDRALIKAAISSLRFFRFNTLKHYCPTLTSMREFITDWA